MRTLFPLPPAKSEREIRNEIRDELARLGLHSFRADAAAKGRARRVGSEGLPDLFGILPSGRWWGVEVKRPRAAKRANEAKQNEVIDHLRSNNAFIVVATNVLEVRAAFQEELKCSRLSP